ncbi:bifunctional DNA primase/polymerase [Nocardioides terrisoli]|uniref:bifunctional DNA primase/polymerase n=1 Tax=Nocardioides terrisoli TaxID=3388267 RepID=UPI00287B9AAA|nr:bifunctional DNA primase/polymerase [Nocardioides marmorisolisilvae]
MFDANNPIPMWSVSTMQRVAEEPSLAAAALRYANLGIPVFPCVPGGKQPLTPNGFHDATSSARAVRAWWERHPSANIGLPTGARTGVVVVDVDVRPGGSGFLAFERARSEGIGEQWGCLVRTPSGGVHAYYPMDADREQRSWQVPSAHVDFRGDGGYVIAPPSHIEIDGTTRTYDVIAVTTQPARPVDAIELRHLLEPPRPAANLRAPTALAGPGCHPPALARTVALTAEGGRNRALFWASCRMAENNFAPTDIASWLVPAAQHAGLGDREIETTINSAVHHAARLGPASRPGPTRTSEGIQL